MPRGSSLEQVPWINDDVLKWSGWSTDRSKIETGVLTAKNTESWSTFINPRLFNVNQPFQVSLKMHGEGRDYGTLIFGRTPTTTYWEGVRRLDIDVSGKYAAILFYDGKNQEPRNFTLKRNPADGQFALRFLDTAGTKIMVLDSEGKPLTVDGQPITLPAKLFPDGSAYFGINVGPSSNIQISQLSMLTPPDGKYVASAVSPDAISIATVDRVAELRAIPAPSDVTALALSPDGKLIAYAWCKDPVGLGNCHEEDVRVVNTETGQQVQRLEVSQTIVMSIEFSPDGKLLLASFNDEVRLWDTSTWNLLGRLEGGKIMLAAFSPDGRQIATWAGGWARGVRLWDVVTRKEVGGFLTDAYVWINDARFFSNGQNIIAQYSGWMGPQRDYGVFVQNLIANNQILVIRNSSYYSVSPNGNRIVVSQCTGDPCNRSKFQVWSFPDGKVLTQFGDFPRNSVSTGAIATDNRLFILTGYEYLGLWDLSTGLEIRHLDTLKGTGYNPRRISLSKDGSLITVAERNLVRVYGLK